MGRLFAIVLFVLGVYVASTVTTEGVDGAFGGLLARESASVDPESEKPVPSATPADAPNRQPVTRRVHDKVQGLVDDRAERASEY